VGDDEREQWSREAWRVRIAVEAGRRNFRPSLLNCQKWGFDAEMGVRGNDQKTAETYIYGEKRFASSKSTLIIVLTIALP
jgi:hypothetical protein